MARTFIPTIDYTSRDYVAVREDMIRIIQARIENWTAESDADFGVALVEAFAHSVDILNYYLDRVGNEAYLSTAVQRESLYSIAKMFNYTPRTATAAAVRLTITNTTPSQVVLPAGTRFQASVNTGSGAVLKNFELTSEAKVDGTNPNQIEPTFVDDIPASEGRTYTDESIALSNGYAAQQYPLLRSSVLPLSITIKTVLTDSAGSTETLWTEVPDILMSGPTSRNFQTILNTDGSTSVRFGNGAQGMIPPQFADIRATYKVGGGSIGNVPPFTITTLVEPVLYGISVTNKEAAEGGQDPESLDSIRKNAARSFRARDRAVTLEDYEILVENLPYAAKAKAVGNNGSSVTVYACPIDDGSGRPFVNDDDGAKLESFITSVKGYLEYRSMAGVSLTVLGPVWVDVAIEMTVNCISSAYQQDVEAEIRSRLTDRYSFDNRDFNGRVSAGDILSAVAGAQGMEYAEVTDIRKGGFPAEGAPRSNVAVIIQEVDGIQAFDAVANLRLNMVGGIGGV